MTTKIRPFADIKTEYTMVHNYVFDVCMPSLSHAGWRILCVAVRKTLGWIDETSPTGRRQWDQISYSQFRKGSGLRSDSSVSKGLKENISAGYIIRRKVGSHQGTGAPLYAYSLNQDYEVTVAATTESVAEESEHKTSTPKNGVAASPKNGVAATTETVETKRKEKAKGKENIDPFSSSWSPVLDSLKLQLTAATFDTWFRGSRLIAKENGLWTVQVESAYAVDWITNRLQAPLKRSLKQQGLDVEIQFVAKEPSK